MEYGKFNSAEELLKGYNELEKSFTQKCQELSALRSEIATQTPAANNTDGTNEDSSPSARDNETAAAVDANAVPADDDASSAVGGNPSPAPAIEQIRQYLDAHPEERDLLLDKAQQQPRVLPRVMNGGGNVSMALPSRPKTLSEASAMAKKLFGGV